MRAAQRGIGNLGPFKRKWQPRIAIKPAIGSRMYRPTDDEMQNIEFEVYDDTSDIEDVWLVVYPPSYRPPTDSRELVQEPEKRSLLLVDGKYIINRANYPEPGTYKIHIHAVDMDGLMATPIVTEIDNGYMMHLPNMHHRCILLNC